MAKASWMSFLAPNTRCRSPDRQALQTKEASFVPPLRSRGPQVAWSLVVAQSRVGIESVHGCESDPFIALASTQVRDGLHCAGTPYRWASYDPAKGILGRLPRISAGAGCSSVEIMHSGRDMEPVRGSPPLCHASHPELWPLGLAVPRVIVLAKAACPLSHALVPSLAAQVVP